MEWLRTSPDCLLQISYRRINSGEPEALVDFYTYSWACAVEAVRKINRNKDVDQLVLLVVRWFTGGEEGVCP